MIQNYWPMGGLPRPRKSTDKVWLQGLAQLAKLKKPGFGFEPIQISKV
jgi:hypothetical protein